MANYVQKAIDCLWLERGQLAERLTQVDAALTELGESVKRPKPARAGKPCCTKSEVLEVLTGLLRDNGPLSPDELEGLAKHKVTNDLGKSLSGFAMRFREALTDALIVDAGSGKLRLAADERSNDGELSR